MHALQLVSSRWSWYVPPAQLVQLSLPLAFAIVPALHPTGSPVPVGQKNPAGHSMQSPLLTITGSDLFVKRPAGHGSGATDRSSQ